MHYLPIDIAYGALSPYWHSVCCAIFLRAPYAMRGTDIASDALSPDTRARHWHSGCCAISLRAMPWTDIAH
eukprot:310655-Rhodomonas_salina.1